MIRNTTTKQSQVNLPNQDNNPMQKELSVSSRAPKSDVSDQKNIAERTINTYNDLLLQKHIRVTTNQEYQNLITSIENETEISIPYLKLGDITEGNKDLVQKLLTLINAKNKSINPCFQCENIEVDFKFPENFNITLFQCGDILTSFELSSTSLQFFLCNDIKHQPTLSLDNLTVFKCGNIHIPVTLSFKNLTEFYSRNIIASLALTEYCQKLEYISCEDINANFTISPRDKKIILFCKNLNTILKVDCEKLFLKCEGRNYMEVVD